MRCSFAVELMIISFFIAVSFPSHQLNDVYHTQIFSTKWKCSVRTRYPLTDTYSFLCFSTSTKILHIRSGKFLRKYKSRNCDDMYDNKLNHELSPCCICIYAGTVLPNYVSNRRGIAGSCNPGTFRQRICLNITGRVKRISLWRRLLRLKEHRLKE